MVFSGGPQWLRSCTSVIFLNNITDGDLHKVFEDHGSVQSARLSWTDMGNDQEAQAAVQALNGQDFNGRPLTVNEARPREERSGGQRPFAGGGGAKRGYGGGKRW
jgi:hypothetical protein